MNERLNWNSNDFNPSPIQLFETPIKYTINTVFVKGYDNFDDVQAVEENDRSGRAIAATKTTRFACTRDDYPATKLKEGIYMIMQSPQYPLHYPTDIKCGWKVVVNIFIYKYIYICILYIII